MKVFLSYRRDDSHHTTDRIYDWLVRASGRHDVFKDVDSVPLGRDFHQVIRDAVGRCDVLLAVIGSGWLTAAKAPGMRRVDDPDDFVRMEIEAALERGIPIVPLLVNNATMPAAEDLPPSLRPLVRHNGMPVRPDPDFRRDMERLIAALSKTRSPLPRRLPVRWLLGGTVVAALTLLCAILAITSGKWPAENAKPQPPTPPAELKVLAEPKVAALPRAPVETVAATPKAPVETVAATPKAPVEPRAILAITPGKGPAENAPPQPSTPPAPHKPDDLPPRVKALVATLQDKEWQVRTRAAKNLASHESAAVVEALTRALGDQVPEVRRAAAQSLGQLGDPAAVPALIRRVADDAWHGLGPLYNPAGQPYDDIAESESQGSKPTALAALKKLAPEKVEEALLEAAKSKSPEVRRWALDRLNESDEGKP